MVKKNKKIISLILSIALAVSVLSGAITSSANEDVVYEECTYVNQFRRNENGDIEEASYAYPAKDGYVFAGWYKKDGSAYIPLSKGEADVTDAGYAKYVKKEVLGVKYQFERDKTTGSDTIDLRMLTSVDCLDYESVGFIYSIGGVRKEVQSDTVYERVLGYADSEGKVYEPSVFSQASKYFMSYTVNDIQKSEYGQQVELIPKWVTKDGTVVIGKGTVFTLQEEIADFYNGLGFENEMDQQAFTGQGQSQDAVIERATHTDISTTALAEGGKYALKLSTQEGNNNKYPTFKILFGEELPIGTVISFKAYGKITSGEYSYNKEKGGQSAFAISGDSPQATIGGDLDQYGQFTHEGWKNITITLEEATTFLSLYWNFNLAHFPNGGEDAPSSGEVCIDNVRIYGFKQGDIEAGISFEYEEHEENLTGQGGANDATIERILYSSVDIKNNPDGDKYVMKLSHASFCWPTFKLNFGKELSAGTVVTFMAYGKLNGATPNKNTNQFEVPGGSHTMKTSGFALEKWTPVLIELKENTSSVNLFWNIGVAVNDTMPSGASGEVYIDNLRIYGTQKSDIDTGLDFEYHEQTEWFTGQGQSQDAVIERATHTDISTTALAEGGKYALKLSTQEGNNNKYPTFKILFGEELPIGTVISFKAYGKITSGEYSYNKEKGGQSAFAISSGGPQATIGGDLDQYGQFTHEGWKDITITLEEATTYLSLYWNFNLANFLNGGEDAPSSGEVYIDNIFAVIPGESEVGFVEGVDFEEAIDAEYFAGQGAWQDAIIERVSYATSEIALLENGGNYVLKLRGERNLYPTFRINFGKELPVGTKITFNVFAKIYGMNLYNQSIFAYSNPNVDATPQFKCGAWETLSITLPATSHYVDLYWNYERAGGLTDGVPGEVYIDNIVVSTP